MLVSDVVSEVVRLVNNPTKSANAMVWIRNALREVLGRGRWQFTIRDRVRQLASSSTNGPLFLPHPSDHLETIEPILYRQDITISSAISIVEVPTLPVATTGDPYYYVFQLSGGSDGWQIPTEPWRWDMSLPLRLQTKDYRIQEYGLELHPRFAAGGAIWHRYYSKLAIPQECNEVVPLPDQFVYKIMVYGAARHGLIGEDDYDRLNYAERMFETGIREMREWDNRRQIANIADRADSQIPYEYTPFGTGQFPPNFAV